MQASSNRERSDLGSDWGMNPDMNQGAGYGPQGVEPDAQLDSGADGFPSNRPAEPTDHPDPTGFAYADRSQEDRFHADRTYSVNPGRVSAGPSFPGNPEPSPVHSGEEIHLRKLMREEIQRNYKPRFGWLKITMVSLFGAILGGLFSLALVASGALKMDGLGAQANDFPSNNVSIRLNEDSTVENAVAQKSIPTIVGITAVLDEEAQDPYFYGFSRPMESVGSGVIVSEDGYILTNSHVVNNGKSKKIKVLFANSAEREAQLMWNDPTLDLAVIKVDQTGLPYAELGDSSGVQVGDKAIAIGNPLGLDLQSTLTSGYVSGLGRSITVEDGNIMDGLIQTDAAINSGNSGGALLNARGQVIGINTARPEIADGIGFSIPINTAKPIIEKIIETGAYEPIYIGIVGYNVQYAYQMGQDELPTMTGVIIREVIAGSPAAKAGIQTDDIIVSIDGKPVDSMNSLKTILVDNKLGDKVTINYYRGDELISKDMVIEAFEHNF